MSYRSFKRVLGENSLERKCRFLFGACLLVLITASFLVYANLTESLVNQQNRSRARLLADQAMIARHWVWLDQGLEQGRPTDRAWIEDLTKGLLSEQECKLSFMRPENPEGANKPLNGEEWEILDYFMKANGVGPTADTETVVEYRERTDHDKNEYYYYQPIRAKKSCIAACHAQTFGGAGVDMVTAPQPIGVVTAEMPGEILSIARITLSNGPTQTALNQNRAILLATAIITVFLAMVAAYLIVRYVIVKPLRHLRDVSDAVSHGNTALRAEIHTGDEFESLGVAFNRMLRHLVSVQDELRHVNTDLDGKVDELAQVNMRLYEMNAIKSDFLATISHELRTPLNSILGFSDVLGSIDTLNDKQKRYVQNIQKSGRTLLEMINDILDLAKIESGKMETRLTDFAVKQIINAQCDMARPLTEKKNIDLEANVAAGLPPMRQDQARVQQILNNLLSNAIKFTPEGGRITVTATRDTQARLVMEVADTGVGIADEDQQVIFEKFRQANTGVPSGDAMTREYSGTGLGLSIVKELCKLLSGEILVESELGKGSTFTVRLPWELDEQPRLDSTMIEGFDEFARPRYDVAHDATPRIAGDESA